jgi:hypothetical protein
MDPDGVSLTLQAKWETANRYAPPVEFEEDGVPGQPGMRFRDVRHGLKEFTQTVWITGTSETDLRTQIRNMVAVMDPTRGQGILRVTAPGGDQRQIRCFYSGGLGLTETLGADSGFLFQRVTLTFRAHSPYWEATTVTTHQYFTSDVPLSSFLGDPFFPLRLTSSEIVVDETLTNTGDVEAWPVVTITGPGGVIRLHNYTTDKTFSLGDYHILNGVVVVDTRPGVKTVIRNVDENLWPYVTQASAMWSLARGDNHIGLEMVSSTPGYSNLKFEYTAQYLSP